MKTTIDIADALLEQARQQARRRGTTVRALVEQGLRELWSADRDFSRFPTLRTVNPLVAAVS